MGRALFGGAAFMACCLRRERALEAQVDQSAVDSEGIVSTAPAAAREAPLLVARSTLDSVKGVEQLIDGLELVTSELAQEREREERTRRTTGKETGAAAWSNPLLLGNQSVHS